MRVETYYDNQIIHLIFPLAEEAARTLIRFQEHYESPKFAGQIFTLGQYKKWYCEEYGAFSYYTDWSGFNFPDTAVLPFRQGLFDPLLPGEEDVMEVLPHVKSGKYYVIGTADARWGGKKTIQHELVHAFYYLNFDYRCEVADVINEYSKKLEPMKKFLRAEGYSDSVFADEANAYLVTEPDYFRDHKILVDSRLVRQLRALHKQYVVKLL